MQLKRVMTRQGAMIDPNAGVQETVQAGRSVWRHISVLVRRRGATGSGGATAGNHEGRARPPSAVSRRLPYGANGQARIRRDAGGTLAGLVLLLVLTAGCGGATDDVVPGADPAMGRMLLSVYGCGACHIIPGVVGADGTIGPPLEAMGRRVYIAGRLHNRPENLINWIMDPHAIEPGTAMPDLRLSEAEASEMAAYLYTLR